MDSPRTEAGAPLRCAAHPGTETYLRCAQCGTPICPRCMVMTPVGAKCPTCARGRTHPSFILTPFNVVAAALVALVGGVVLGVLAGIVVRIIPFLSILFPFVAGLVLADLITRVVRHKHSPLLQVIAGASVVVSYFALSLGDFVLIDPLGLLSSGLLPRFLLNTLVGMVVNPFNLIFLAIGVWIAIQRV